MRQTFSLPASVDHALKTLTDAGFHAYVVGGAVRDLLRGHTPKDWDVTTNATPEQIMKLFPNAHLDNAFGTVGVPLKYLGEKKNTGVLEITPFRTEGPYQDFRRPSSVSWGKTIEEDLERRDFTINAMAFSPIHELVDPFGGKTDLHHAIIRTVGKPHDRFSEDALRMLRAVRLHIQLGFTVDPTTLMAIKENSHLLRYISGERIRDELLLMLKADLNLCAEGFSLMRDLGILTIILPELDAAFAQKQARHHTWDVGKHSIESLRHCPSNDPVVRLATLLHDIGKPAVAKRVSSELVTFFNHEVVGVPIARNILDRLHVSKKDRDRILNLIRWHQFSVDEYITDAAVRRFIARVGPDNIDDMIDLRIGDRLGGGCKEAESWRLKLFRKRLWEVQHPPPTVADLAIDGNDVMKILDLKPGPQVGAVLKELFEETVDEPKKNNREYLLRRLETILKGK
ncbi:MAG: CCA tRNA nucleotidyltransferase [bacterium]|nr:CCA tRNA nucleotidyltransferase [bacterium]